MKNEQGNVYFMKFRAEGVKIFAFFEQSQRYEIYKKTNIVDSA